jgi:hypothetical protein
MSGLVLFTLLLLPTIWIALAVTADPRIKACMQSRKNAEERADELLRSWLTWEQLRQWRSRRQFEVIGCDTGSRYRLTQSAVMNVHQLDESGRCTTRWCFMPKGDLARGDVLLAQKIALETMERKALTVANASQSIASFSRSRRGAATIAANQVDHGSSKIARSNDREAPSRLA